MQCVDFLVQFGVNLYALDIDNHTAQDLAAINNRDNILRYLDAAAANLEAVDKYALMVWLMTSKLNSCFQLQEKSTRLEREGEKEVRQKGPRVHCQATEGR